MTSKFPDLKKKNIIITGGNGFLGKQLTKAFINQGSNVFIFDLKTSKNKKNLKYFNVDITREKQLSRILEKFKKDKIKADILINNAAYDHTPKKKNNMKLNLEDYSIENFNFELNVGLTGSFLCTKLFGNYMSKNKGGVILNISSDLGIIAPNQEVYKPSNFIKPVTYSIIKHGIIGLTKYTAAYWAKKKIRCNAIAPGGIYNNQNKTFVKNIKKLIPMGRMAKKNEYNDLVLFLCSKSSSYINGSVVIADGGRSII